MKTTDGVEMTPGMTVYRARGEDAHPEAYYTARAVVQTFVVFELPTYPGRLALANIDGVDATGGVYRCFASRWEALIDLRNRAKKVTARLLADIDERLAANGNDPTPPAIAVDLVT